MTRSEILALSKMTEKEQHFFLWKEGLVPAAENDRYRTMHLPDLAELEAVIDAVAAGE